MQVDQFLDSYLPSKSISTAKNDQKQAENHPKNPQKPYIGPILWQKKHFQLLSVDISNFFVMQYCYMIFSPKDVF